MKITDAVAVPLAWVFVATVAGFTAFYVGQEYGRSEAVREHDRQMEEMQREGRGLVTYHSDKDESSYY